MLVIFSLLSLYLTYRLFWRRYEPKVIFFGIIQSWLSITIKIFYADFKGVNYESLSFSPSIIQTTYISLIGYCVLCLGIYMAIRDMRLSDKNV
ncbi:MAG: hypothetical protein IPP31_09980 [Chitinophagaceae bacterium]|nr:hypothetical protein [Chitinophagaceae bacterium]